MNENRNLFNKMDLYIIGFLLVMALILIFLKYPISGNEARCGIFYEGRIVVTLDLSKDGIFSIPQKPNVRFEIKNGSVAFIESDCHDKICVKSGFLKHAGQTAACLPNKLSIRITQDKAQPDDADAAAY